MVAAAIVACLSWGALLRYAFRMRGEGLGPYNETRAGFFQDYVQRMSAKGTRQNAQQWCDNVRLLQLRTSSPIFVTQS